MSTFKKAKVVMLPTNEAKGDFSKERIYPCLLKHSWMFDKEEKGKLIFANSNIRTPTQLQNLYFLSDEEIKEGDWFIFGYNLENDYEGGKDYKITNNDVIQCLEIKDNKYIIHKEGNTEIENCKKIIATTDVSLGLPQPSQQFIQKYIEEYNKGNVITDVLVEYEYLLNDMGVIPYWCLKINPKDNTITIRKVKDSWNKEEIIKLIKSFANNYQYASNDIGYNKWIEENL